MKRAIVLIAQGTEEMEAVIAIDVLRRASVEVLVVSVNGPQVICARKTKILPDKEFESITESEWKNFDLVVLPGGFEGAKTFATHSRVHDLLKYFEKEKMVGVICASPIALKAASVGLGKVITSHPSVKDQLEGYQYSEDHVVVDGNLVTSRGPGTSFLFALKLVELLCGSAVRDQVAAPMMLP